MGPTFQTRSLRGSTSLSSRRKQVTDPTGKQYLECQLSVKAPPNPRVRSRSSHTSRRLRDYRLPPVVWLCSSVRPCVRMLRNFPLYTHFIALLRCLCFSTITLLTPDFGQTLLCPRLAFPLRTWLEYTPRTVHPGPRIATYYKPGQLGRVGFLLSPCGSQGLITGHLF